MDNNVQSTANEIAVSKNENAELKKERMDEMPSSSIYKNASAGEIGSPPNKKAKKSLKFGGWLPDCLDWFKRPELSQSALSTSSLTFNQYCWPHLHGRKVKPHNVNYLRFCLERDDEGNLQKVLVKDSKLVIPIADINPPEYITGFEEIEFCYINDQILQFMEAILPMLKDEIAIQFNGSYCHQEIGDNSPTSPFSKLIAILAPKRKKLEFGVDDFDFMEFHRRFPNFIYGCQFISLARDHKKEFTVTPEGLCFTTRVPVDLFVQWLNVPMEDGNKPRILSIGFHRRCHSMDLIGQIKEEFSKSTKSANFIFQLNNCDGEENYNGEEQIHHGVEIFKIENEVTGEILALHEWPFEHILIRFKKEGEKTQMREGMKKLNQESKTTIIIG